MIDEGYVRLSDVYELIDRAYKLEHKWFSPEMFYYFLDCLKERIGDLALTDAWNEKGSFCNDSCREETCADI